MVYPSVVILDGEEIEDAPEIFDLYGTNDKKVDPVNFQKIISYDHEAEKSPSKRKNRKSISIVRYN